LLESAYFLSLNKTTEYSAPCLISIFEKIETLPKFSSFPRSIGAYSTRARGNKWDMPYSQQIRELLSTGVQNKRLHTKKSFQLIIRQTKDEKTHHFFSCRSESSQLPSS
jgi:hypothetical protein